jgi:hypothetical protein
MLFIITSGLNTGLAAIAITTISGIYLSRYLGHTHFNVQINNKKTRIAVPTNITRLSYAQQQLRKHAYTSIEYLDFQDGHVVIRLRESI